MEISVNNISKEFGKGKNRTQALNDISFKAKDGDILALIGRNGAGKSSLLKILIGVNGADQGEITIDGGSIQHRSSHFKNMLGYIPEEQALSEVLVVSDWLELQAEIKGVESDLKTSLIKNLSEEFEIEQFSSKKIQKLSKGEAQRVAIVGALLNNPKFVVFDEPFYGLDPVQTQKLRTHIKKLSENGSIIILSTHQMSEAELFCKRLLILNKGKLLADQTLSNIKEAYPGQDLDQIFCKLTNTQDGLQ